MKECSSASSRVVAERVKTALLRCRWLLSRPRSGFCVGRSSFRAALGQAEPLARGQSQLGRELGGRAKRVVLGRRGIGVLRSRLWGAFIAAGRV